MNWEKKVISDQISAIRKRRDGLWFVEGGYKCKSGGKPPHSNWAKGGAPSSTCVRIPVAGEAAGCIFNSTKDGKIKIPE
jgi:hypothetical protein